MTEHLSDEALEAIEKITKLLALAKDTRGNEAEAENAMNMALKLLERHNLDMAVVERAKGGTGHSKRDDKTRGGGLYKWQRELWDSVAKLNMCVYFSIKGLEKGSKYENRLVGKAENVLVANLMGDYLQDTVERIAAEWAKDMGYQSRFVREAIIYREGMAARLSERLWQLRYEREQEAKAQKAEAMKASGGENALVVITDVIQDEKDLNADYLHGLEPGTHKKWRLEAQARNLAYQREAEEKRKAHEARMLIDPAYAEKTRMDAMVAAQREKEANAKWQRQQSRRTYSARETAEDRRRSSHEFRAGYHKGADIGLDRQVDKNSTKAIG